MNSILEKSRHKKIPKNEILPTYLLFFFFPFQFLFFFYVKWPISTKEEILSRPLVDVTHINETDIQSINVTASTSTEFDLKLSVKRKSSEAQNINCHFVAVTCIGRKPTHFLITFGMTSNISTVTDHLTNSDVTIPIQTPILPAQQSQQSQQTSSMPKPNTEPRGSLHGSIRRGKLFFLFIFRFACLFYTTHVLKKYFHVLDRFIHIAGLWCEINCIGKYSSNKFG